jgi:hypothetical protein
MFDLDFWVVIQKLLYFTLQKFVCRESPGLVPHSYSLEIFIGPHREYLAFHLLFFRMLNGLAEGCGAPFAASPPANG